ncbi:MAG: hypothetical protein ACI87E_003614 [Mariniblastus sp.]|jgi:hypothetical protein
MRQRFWASISKIYIPAIALSVFVSGAGIMNAQATAQEETTTVKRTTEPVFRVSKLTSPGQVKAPVQPAVVVQEEGNGVRIAGVPTNIPDSKAIEVPGKVPVSAPAAAPHPLDRAVSVAQGALTEMRSGVSDYTAILAKREQINGVVGEPSYMNVKIRCPREHTDGSISPFSIYMKFLRPKASSGREVIWVDGENEGKLVVHESGGLIGMKTFRFDPTSRIAMNGQRYPIYEAGLENLIVKLIEKAERDREAGPCKVEYRKGVMINKRPCSLIELTHEDRKAPYEFHKAQVFIDNELNLPVRFAAYDWPQAPGEAPKLLEEYTYYNVKVNVGLEDVDFDPTNPNYRYPSR